MCDKPNIMASINVRVNMVMEIDVDVYDHIGPHVKAACELVFKEINPILAKTLLKFSQRHCIF